MTLAGSSSDHVEGRIPGTRFLHAPGPTRVPDAVLHAMSRQPMDLADARVPALIAACEHGLKALLQTRQSELFFYAANGHGAWEAVIVNLLAPGQTVLVPATGHFAESWGEQAAALGASVVMLPYVQGLPIDPAAVEAALRADSAQRIVAVFVVHTDTASSISCDLSAVRAAIDAARHPALLVVDVVASLAAAPFAMDALGVNVAMGASQKGLMLPPGLAFVAADARAMAVARRNPRPRFYWDWMRRQSALQYRRFCGTPPLAHLAGLEAALALIAQEGLPAVHARHRRLAAAVQAAVECWAMAGALQLLCRVPQARSVSVTAVQVRQGHANDARANAEHATRIDPEALRTLARERFQVAIAGGLGAYAGKAFRIGHLGDMNEAMVLGCLAGVEAAMTVQQVPFGRGGVDAAVAVLAMPAGHVVRG